MEILLTKYHWLQLSNEQRFLLRKYFQIPKSGGVEMQDNKMLSDGSNEHDLKAVNIASMHSFLGEDSLLMESFEELYNLTIAKIDLLIEEEKKNLEAWRDKDLAEERNKKINEIVGSTILTIENLPTDAQAKIYNHMLSRFQKVTSSAIVDSNINTIITTTNVKKAGRPKKVKEGNNQ